MKKQEKIKLLARQARELIADYQRLEKQSFDMIDAFPQDDSDGFYKKFDEYKPVADQRDKVGAELKKVMKKLIRLEEDFDIELYDLKHMWQYVKLYNDTFKYLEYEEDFQ